MKKAYTDKELVSAIQEGGTAIERAMNYLYQDSGYRPMIYNWLGKKGAKLEEKEDVFQDAVRHLIMNVKEEKFRGDSALKTYLFRICSNIWNTSFKREKKLEDIKAELPVEIEVVDSPEEILMYKEKSLLLEDVLGQLGDRCKEVLGLWSLSYTMKEIAEKAGYKSDGMVRKKKHQCFKSLMVLLKDKPDIMTELLNNR